MTAALAQLGALADSHPRVVFAMACLLASAGLVSLALGAALWAARRIAARNERAEGA